VETPVAVPGARRSCHELRATMSEGSAWPARRIRDCCPAMAVPPDATWILVRPRAARVNRLGPGRKEGGRADRPFGPADDTGPITGRVCLGRFSLGPRSRLGKGPPSSRARSVACGGQYWDFSFFSQVRDEEIQLGVTVYTG